MVSRRGLLVGSAAGLLAARVARAGAPIDELLRRVARARSGMRTLQGPFTQTRTIGLLATEVRSRGTLTLVCPDRLRWDLAPPDDVTFYVGPEGLAFRGAHGQAAAGPASPRFAGVLDDLRTLLGGDLAALRVRWDLSVVRDDATGAEIEAASRPGAGVAPLSSIRFALAPDLVRPTRALLVSGPKDRTDVQFGAMVVDGPVDPAKMRPSP
jgi:hypothetical protein